MGWFDRVEVRRRAGENVPALAVARTSGAAMMVTRHYLLGELLLRMDALQAAAPCAAAAERVACLRRQAENTSPDCLGPLVERAVCTAEGLCWESLARGDAAGFACQAQAAADLFEFGLCSGLLPGPNAD